MSYAVIFKITTFFFEWYFLGAHAHYTQHKNWHITFVNDAHTHIITLRTILKTYLAGFL